MRPKNAFTDLITRGSAARLREQIKSDQDLKESVRNHVQTGHHPASTCAMGSSNNKMAVLDNQLKVRGIDNLRVVDASSFPDMISGNINASVIMLAEKASDMILKINQSQIS